MKMKSALRGWLALFAIIGLMAFVEFCGSGQKEKSYEPAHSQAIEERELRAPAGDSLRTLPVPESAPTLAPVDPPGRTAGTVGVVPSTPADPGRTAGTAGVVRQH